METNTALWLEVNCSERDSFRCHSQFGLFGFFFFLTRCFIVYTTTLFPACGQSKEGKGAKKRTVQGQEEKQSQEQAVLYYRGRAGRRDPTRPQRRRRSTKKRDRFCFLLQIAAVCWIERRLFSTFVSNNSSLRAISTFTLWFGEEPKRTKWYDQSVFQSKYFEVPGLGWWIHALLEKEQEQKQRKKRRFSTGQVK